MRKTFCARIVSLEEVGRQSKLKLWNNHKELDSFSSKESRERKEVTHAKNPIKNVDSYAPKKNGEGAHHQ